MLALEPLRRDLAQREAARGCLMPGRHAKHHGLSVQELLHVCVVGGDGHAFLRAIPLCYSQTPSVCCSHSSPTAPISLSVQHQMPAGRSIQTGRCSSTP